MILTNLVNPQKEDLNMIIPPQRISHMHGVAEYMYKNANKYNLDKNKMYVVGLLHDIGYLFGKKNHAQSGAELMSALGFEHSVDISKHGDIPKDNEMNDILKLLLEADLMVGPNGNLLGYNARLADIGERLGYNSEAYMIAKETIHWLVNNT